ncbi:hypothetical protein DCAR_0101280 [Daucus carota subsp. sativus]|uniref:Uncharacterized protein n=1 Tax=Daucus carota subsp. sativus TaxID=79200 RepID=A0A166G9A0_DAUCS|nr:PREDICTED: protein IDA-LIKE 2-like [Daucus carota subsp. sativus]WOG82118.1 hypothetical protein DCAR_0101280 [Daucus carota subsp. sativus]
MRKNDTRSSRFLLILLHVWFIVMISAEASRTNSNIFNPKARPNSGHFLNNMPRRMPIPFSGPSRRHNDIGLESWNSP